MPLTHFVFQGERYEVEEAISSGVLADYFPSTYLRSCADQREWTGTPSVTQLINGTRQEYLKIREDYAEDPDQMAFRVLGTRAHFRLEQHADPVEVDAELKLQLEEGITGISDLMEPYDGYWRVCDYKVPGAFVPKKLCVGTAAEKRAAWETYALQGNCYRIMAQRQFPERELHPKKPLWLFLIVRDGGTWTAEKFYGLPKSQRTVMLPMPVWPDKKVLAYFREKKKALDEALEADKLPQLCNAVESWDGRRCKGYCSVSGSCGEYEREAS